MSRLPRREAPKPNDSKSYWKIATEKLDESRKAVVNVGMVAAVFFVLFLGIQDFKREDEVIIEPFVLPKTLLDLGYTGQMPAYRISDQIEKITRGSTTSRPQAYLSNRSDGPQATSASDLGNLKIPETGITLQSLLQSIRQFLGHEETRIAGNFVCGTVPCSLDELYLRLSIKVGTKYRYVALDKFDPKKIDTYYFDAAKKILLEINPHVLALYLTKTKDTEDEGVAIALKLIAESHPDRIWAHNVLGNYNYDRGRFDRAKFHYDKSIEIDKDFPPAHINIGNMYRSIAFSCRREKDEKKANKYFESAAKEYQHALAYGDEKIRARYSDIAVGNLSRVFDDRGDTEAAIASLKSHIQNGGSSKSHLYRMGYFYQRRKEYDKADYYLTLAKALQPDEYWVLYFNGVVKMQLRDYPAAIENFKTASMKPDTNVKAAYVKWAEALESAGLPADANKVRDDMTRIAEHGSGVSPECKDP